MLADQCAALLQRFFQHKRVQSQADSSPLRQDALRTPETRFSGLQGYPWGPQYVSDLPALAGLRLHYLDLGPQDAAQTWLCLHGPMAWSYQYRKKITALLAAGHRVVAPDLIGFGKSDKPKKESFHTLQWHQQVLLQLVERLELSRAVLLQPLGILWPGQALMSTAPQCFGELVLIDLGPPNEQEQAAYEAPFPDRGHRTALRAVAAMLASALEPKSNSL